ncbi:MAG: hypothetical protein Q9227_000855 [Pyrenula ochraceoflavens]
MSSGRRPMPIPNRSMEDVPPALPPPRHLEALENGRDIGWTLGNTGAENSYGSPSLAPIRNSSLSGGFPAASFGGRRRDGDRGNRLDREKSNRANESAPPFRSPSDPKVKVEGPCSLGELFKSADSGNPRLQGERPLAQQSLNHSSNAYDKQVLSKIGRPNSPPRPSFLSSIPETSRPNLELSHPTGDGNTSRRLAPTETSKLGELPSGWITSPSSTAVSPNARSYRDYTEFRSPSVDSNAPSSTAETEYFARGRDSYRASTISSLPGTDESVSLPSRSKRGSYDQAYAGETEADYPVEETGAMRLRDRTPPHSERRSSYSTQGVKRRASSPPPAREPSREEKVQAQGSSHDAFQRVPPSQYLPRSPNTRFHPNHGSVSSTASSLGLRNGSYASSTGLSAGASSMTSVSSVGRHSPRAVSPCSDVDPAQDSPYIGSASLNASPRTSVSASRTMQHSALSEIKSPYIPRKMSGPSPASLSVRSGVQRMSGLFICECCPKKPKKFDSAEELHIHEMEKQYTCQFCNNRFKNKNEAERHQNSLHLRRHSWSCAAISCPEAAFHPSPSHKHQTPNGPSADTCGYCGEDFANFPHRDWNARYEHLNSVHKFAECNHSKKFFRADHFRQHLKHSHAGASGKWTNMLENACMREEIPADTAPGTLSRAASDYGGRGLISGIAGPGPATTAAHAGYASGVIGKTIDERQDES